MTQDRYEGLEPLTIEEKVGDPSAISISVFGADVTGVTGAKVVIPAVDAMEYHSKMAEIEARGDMSSMTLEGSNLEIENDTGFGDAWNDETVVYKDQVTFRAEDRHVPEEYVEFSVSLTRIEDYLEKVGLLPRADRRTTPDVVRSPGLSF